MAKARRDDEDYEEEDRPRARAPRREEEDEPPRPRKPRRRDEEYEEEERPRAQRRPVPRSERDDYDEEEERRPRRPEREGSSIIPTRNVFALIGYYLAFASLIAILGTVGVWMSTEFPKKNFAVYNIFIFGLGGMLALVALVFGIVGTIKANKNPRVKGTTHAIIAMVMGLVEIVALLIMLLIRFPTSGR